jgi:hypothetical protein
LPAWCRFSAADAEKADAEKADAEKADAEKARLGAGPSWSRT